MVQVAETPEDTTDVIMTKTATEANNADGDATIRIYGYNKDGETNKLFDDRLAVNLQPGEVFFPKTLDANGDVTKYVKMLENKNGVFSPSTAFVYAYRDMCDVGDDSTYYFGKVDYKMGNTIYFENLLDDSAGSFAAKYESIVLPDAIKVMVYDQSKADGYKVSYEDADYMSYSSRVNADGSYPIAKPSIKSYYVLAREYKGKIVDVVYYCYTTDVVLPN